MLAWFMDFLYPHSFVKFAFMMILFGVAMSTAPHVLVCTHPVLCLPIVCFPKGLAATEIVTPNTCGVRHYVAVHTLTVPVATDGDSVGDPDFAKL